MTRLSYIWILTLTVLVSCHGKSDPEAATSTDSTAEAEGTKTPVTITNVIFSDLADSIQLNATSSFLQNSYVRSIATGYVRSVTTRPGEFVGIGKPLFTIETKESTVIGNSISKLDSSFKFSGVTTVRSSLAGYVTQLNHQVGDYVQDGEQLAVISDRNSFVFLLNLPYELRPYVLGKKKVDLVLPDGARLTGAISEVMPVVDSATQTQPVVIKVSSSAPIPQNVVAKVIIIKSWRPHAQTLPKSAILSDEAQTSFWVMKLIDSATAVKVPIKKGLEQNNSIEILDPVFSANDQVLITGNYGLSDTAKVAVEKQ
ncbi:MAG: HlyD family efflux transporter periplasmic adaptor subunit [Bacteroidetes bacterium]|nr:HlyD family efflux transporter periplasmic adaptor subunit [Bacteroidota bacterium]